MALSNSKPSALETSLRLAVPHESAPDKTRAQILGHHHCDSGINADHVGVIPVLQRIERIHEAITGPATVTVALLYILQNTKGWLSHEWQ